MGFKSCLFNQKTSSPFQRPIIPIRAKMGLWFWSARGLIRSFPIRFVFIDFLEFIEVLLQFEKAVPVGIIRGSHHRTLPGPSSLMMPEVVERYLEFIDPGIVLQQVFTFEFVEHCFCGFVIGLIVKPDGLVALLEKVVGVEFHMT